MFNWIVSRSKLHQDLLKQLIAEKDFAKLQRGVIKELAWNLVMEKTHKKPVTQLTEEIYRRIQNEYDLPETIAFPMPVTRLRGRPVWLPQNIDVFSALILLEIGYVPPTALIEKPADGR